MKTPPVSKSRFLCAEGDAEKETRAVGAVMSMGLEAAWREGLERPRTGELGVAGWGVGDGEREEWLSDEGESGAGERPLSPPIPDPRPRAEAEDDAQKQLLFPPAPAADSAGSVVALELNQFRERRMAVSKVGNT